MQPFGGMFSRGDWAHRMDAEVLRMRKRWVLAYGMTIVCVLLAASWGSRAVTVVAEHSPISREHVLILDPGHGGEDGGAVSCTGLAESAYNLDIALRLRDLLHLMGREVRMIRTTDEAVYTRGETLAQKKASDLRQRTAMVNETENGILLSIHQNHFPDSRYSGAQVFYASTEGSEALARQLQEAFRQTLNPQSNRQCKPSKGVYLMEHIQRPGVLIECGFLSNPAEEAKLRTPDYQKQLCGVIAAEVSRFLTQEAP